MARSLSEGQLIVAGTKAGSAKAVATILARDPDFFKRVGKIGGSKGKGPGYQGGFAHPEADPRKAGAIGGRVSRRKSPHLNITSPDTVTTDEG